MRVHETALSPTHPQFCAFDAHTKKELVMKRTPLIISSAFVGGVLLAFAGPLAASAHVSVSASSTAAGSYSVLTFSVSHGCDGSPTESIAITLPESIVSATPTVNQGWTISTVTEPLDEPITKEEGEPVTERISQIVYTAKTPLAADQRDTFALSLALAGNAGDTLEFPTLQTCTVGETEWAGNEVPAITLTEASAEGEHAHGDSAAHSDIPNTTGSNSDDVLARVLGIGGLALGAAGLVIGLSARRRSA